MGAAFMCHYTAYVDDEEVEGPEQVNSSDEHEGKYICKIIKIVPVSK